MKEGKNTEFLNLIAGIEIEEDIGGRRVAEVCTRSILERRSIVITTLEN